MFCIYKTANKNKQMLRKPLIVSAIWTLLRIEGTCRILWPTNCVRNIKGTKAQLNTAVCNFSLA